jgi:hypothetical protein
MSKQISSFNLTSTASNTIFNANVGIGTNNPSTKFHVLDTTTTTGNIEIVSFYSSGLTTGGMQFKIGKENSNGNTAEFNYNHVGTDNDDNRLTIGFHSSSVMTLKNNGNVGIGTTNPLNRLTLRQDQNAFSTIEIRNNNTTSLTSGSQIVFGTFRDNNPNDYEGAKIRAITVDSEFGALVKYGELAFHTQNNIGDQFADERMRIKTNGNVGIGTTNPAVRLHILETATTTGTIDISEFFSSGLTTGAVQLKLGKEDTTGNTAEIKYTHVNPNATTNRLGLGFAGTEAISIVNNGGRVGIGTTNPINPLHVHRNDATTFLANTDQADTGRTISIYNTNATTNAFAGLSLRTNGALCDMKLVHTGSNVSKLVHTLRNNATWHDVMTLDAANSGRVGIGTTSPTHLLHVNGNANISGVLTMTKTIQSGSSNGGGSHTGTVTFPVAFDSTPRVIVSIRNPNTANVYHVEVTSISASSFDFIKRYQVAGTGGAWLNATSETFDWIASVI